MVLCHFIQSAYVTRVIHHFFFNRAVIMSSVKACSVNIITDEEILGTSALEVKCVDDIYSQKLGATSKLGSCETCFQTWHRCSGHHGHMILTIPVIKIHFVKNMIAYLNTQCIFCADEHATDCDHPKLQYKANLGQLQIHSDSTIERCIGPVEIYEFLLSREKQYFFWKVLYIPSLNTRPPYSSVNANSRKSTSDWSRQLKLIIQAELRIRQLKDVPCVDWVVNREPGHQQALYTTLTHYISAFHSSSIKMKLQTVLYTSTLENVEDRFKNQKAGRLRANIIARRVNHAIRGVLEGTIDTHLDVIEIPRSECMKITKKTKVNTFNRQFLFRMIIRGPHAYPGANSVILRNGDEIDLDYISNRRDIDINEIDYVKRHLLANDLVLINRQPTLHRGSMFALKLRPSSEKVLRIHYALFPPLGADCDGDELNVHVPQTLTGQADLELLQVAHNMLKDGHITTTFIQNAVIGAYLMTQDKTYFTYMQACQLVSQTCFELSDKCTQFDTNRISGKRVVSLLFPSDFYFEHASCSIRHGQLTRGCLNKSALNSSPNGILYRLHRMYSPSRVMEFIFQGYRMFQSFLDTFGHSTGLFDCYDTVACAHMDPSAVLSSNEHINPQSIQTYMASRTDTLKDKTYAFSNGLVSAISSSAKGSWDTLNLMTGSIGQVYVNYKRYEHTSSHSDGQTLQSRGFIQSNYTLGVNLQDYINEAPATCESVVCKNRGTAKSGYAVRKMSCCLIGLKLNANGSVVDEHNHQIWRKYGDDNFQAEYINRFQCTFTLDSYDPSEVAYLKHLNRSLNYTAGDTFTITSPVDLKYIVRWSLSEFEQSGLSLTKERIASYTLAFVTGLVRKKLIHNTDRLWQMYYLFNVNSVTLHHCSEQSLQRIFRRVYRSIRSSRCIDGEAVGVHAAQCVGEPLTQMSLKTPHKSGNFEAVTVGYERFNELLDSSAKNATMHIFFNKKDLTYVDIALFGSHMIALYLRDLLCGENQSNLSVDDNGTLTVHFVLSREACIKNFISPRGVAQRLCSALSLSYEQCQFVSPFSANWTCSLQIHSCNQIWSAIHTSARSASTKLALMYYHLINNVLLRGNVELTNFIVNQPLNKCIILGSDLSHVLKYDIVDVRRTYSTDISECLKVFGRVVALKILQNEFQQILSDTSHARHIGLVSRFMIFDGTFRGFHTRHLGQRSSFIQRATFEQTMKHLTHAALHCERDACETLAGALFVNKPTHVGSNVCSLRMTQQCAQLPSKKYLDGMLFEHVTGTHVFVFIGDKATLVVERKTRTHTATATIPELRNTLLEGVRDVSGSIHIYDILCVRGNVTTSLRIDHKRALIREVLTRTNGFLLPQFKLVRRVDFKDRYNYASLVYISQEPRAKQSAFGVIINMSSDLDF